MSDTKMLQAILDGQSAIKEELKADIGKLGNRVASLEAKVDKGFEGVDKRLVEVNERIDKLGLQIANLEDDAPTVEEFDALEKE
jgi:polyhydroxyalkanoate synthesis regulator phasin